MFFTVLMSTIYSHGISYNVSVFPKFRSLRAAALRLMNLGGATKEWNRKYFVIGSSRALSYLHYALTSLSYHHFIICTAQKYLVIFFYIFSSHNQQRIEYEALYLNNNI